MEDTGVLGHCGVQCQSIEPDDSSKGHDAPPRVAVVDESEDRHRKVRAEDIGHTEMDEHMSGDHKHHPQDLVLEAAVVELVKAMKEEEFWQRGTCDTATMAHPGMEQCQE